jgi:hypothetical protein
MVVTQPGDLDDSPIHILTPAQLAVPAEAGNVVFLGDEPVDDIVDWRPITGLQLLAFCMLFAVLSALIVAASGMAAGYACGMPTTNIIASVLAWGRP